MRLWALTATVSSFQLLVIAVGHRFTASGAKVTIGVLRLTVAKELTAFASIVVDRI